MVVVPPIIALTLGVIRRLARSLWRDEWATALHASLTAADLVRSLAGGDAVQGPYYLLIGLLSPMIGLEEGMRIPSLLAFAATAAIVAALVMRWWGPWAGAAAGVFFSLNGAALTAGTTARPTRSWCCAWRSRFSPPTARAQENDGCGQAMPPRPCWPWPCI